MNKTFHSNNYHYTACVGTNGGYEYDVYVKGYSDAVKLLLHAMMKDKTVLDTIVYPIIFSARHFIELYLKEQLPLLAYLNKYQNSNYSYTVLTTHSIKRLWTDFKELAKVDKRYTPLVENSDEIINDFSEIDDNGETFRYPYSKDENKHLTELHHIDLNDFRIRFIELAEVLESIENLTDFLVEEYKQRSIVSGVTRNIIESIAEKLPNISTWNSQEFSRIKNEIISEFNLSSNKLSKIIDFIKSHREFSKLIGCEIPITELTSTDLKWFKKTYEEFRDNPNDYSYNENIVNTTRKIERKFSKVKIASLSQLFNMGYFRLFSEEYDNGVNLMKKRDTDELVRNYLLSSGIVIDKIKLALNTMGQDELFKSL